MKDYKSMSDYFKWVTIYVIPETYRAMTLVVGECLKVEAINLFTTSYGKHVVLDEFEATQIQVTNNVSQSLVAPNSDQLFFVDYEVFENPMVRNDHIQPSNVPRRSWKRLV